MALVASVASLVQWSWVYSERSTILSLLVQHLELTAIAVAVGLLISLPFGVLAWKVRLVRPALFGFAGLLYVVPSVALLALVAPATGFFSTTTAEVALVGYTLLVLVRNIVAGLESVPSDTYEAARGLGYSATGLLLHVQLPLAAPSILAGIRVATVTTVGLVNVTAFVGQGGLGQLIIEGFQQDFNTPVIVGLVLSVLLAGIADLGLVAVERASLPWATARRRAR